jgi:hypothetical protein
MYLEVIKEDLWKILSPNDRSKIDKIKTETGVITIQAMSEGDWKTHQQIKAFKGICRLCFNAGLTDYDSPEMVEKHFKKQANLIDSYDCWVNDKPKTYKDRADIPRNAVHIKMQLKSCADMTKTEMNHLIEILLTFMDMSIVNMSERHANEFCKIRENMEMRSWQRLQDQSLSKN